MLWKPADRTESHHTAHLLLFALETFDQSTAACGKLSALTHQQPGDIRESVRWITGSKVWVMLFSSTVQVGDSQANATRFL